MKTETPALPMEATGVAYRDPKRYAYLLVPLWILSPVFCLGLAVATGNAAWYWAVIVATYIAFPILDLDPLIGRNTINPPESLVPAAWARIPATWQCPDCAVRDKVDFVRI